jgi:dihydroorotase/N-acyl-D-amino-acid deacylase
MSEENLRLQMRQPWITFSTDAAGVDPATRKESGWLHPRAFGTYPRILGHYVREEGVIPLEEAIRKMTSAVANRLSIRDRGLLRSGMAADVVLFDPATVSDRATFDNPHQLSQGIRDVWVNGDRVLSDGTHTGKMPGKWLKGAGPTSA